MAESRQIQDKVFIGIALTLAIIMLPLGVYRIILADWVIALFDFTASIISLALAFNVYFTRNLVLAKKIFSLFIGAAVLTTVYLKGKPQFIWLYPALAIIFYLTPALIALRVAVIAICVMVVLMFGVMTQFELISMTLSYILTVACLFALSYQWRQHQKELTKLSNTDPLTNIKNRRAFINDIEYLINEKRHIISNNVLLIFDIDNFKGINDSMGHSVGDKVLIEITELINSRLRKSDEFYRIGGEEFIITLQNVTIEAAQLIAEDIRQLIESSRFIQNLSVTISIGLTKYIHESDNADSWLNRADKALYQAKESGRNKVCTN